MTEFTILILENQEAWSTCYREGWLKRHQDTGEFDWKLYEKPVNAQSVAGGAVKYLPDAGRVVNELVPQIIEAVYAEKADAALLVPS